MRLIFLYFYSKRIIILYYHLQNNFLLRPHTALETFLSLLIAVLEPQYWKNLQLVGFNRLHVFDCPKMISLEVIFQLWEEEKVTRTQARRIIHRKYVPRLIKSQFNNNIFELSL